MKILTIMSSNYKKSKTTNKIPTPQTRVKQIKEKNIYNLLYKKTNCYIDAPYINTWDYWHLWFLKDDKLLFLCCRTKCKWRNAYYRLKHRENAEPRTCALSCWSCSRGTEKYRQPQTCSINGECEPSIPVLMSKPLSVPYQHMKNQTAGWHHLLTNLKSHRGHTLRPPATLFQGGIGYLLFSSRTSLSLTIYNHKYRMIKQKEKLKFRHVKA